MSIWNGNTIKSSKLSSYQNDSFGRSKIGIPNTLYEYNFQYNKAPLVWDEVISGSGVATHLPNESSIQLSTGDTVSGSGATRQTLQYFRYRPGKELSFQETFAFGDIQTNVVKRVGYYDSNNGIFLEQNGTDGLYYLVLRSKTTGSIIDIKIQQSDWNIDQLNLADFTKVQIFSCSLQWLGVGSVLCGFVIDRIFRPVHIFNHANISSSVYMTTPNLPVKYEIYNDGTGEEIGTMKQICATVITNAGTDSEVAYTHSVQNTATKTVGTTLTNLLTIRPKLLFNSIENRGQINPGSISIVNTGTGTAIYKLVYNTTLGGTPSYNSASSNSIVEYDIAGTTVTGGEVIDSGFVSSSVQAKSSQQISIGFRYPLTLDAAGSVQNTLTLAVQALSGTVDVMGSITFNENY